MNKIKTERVVLAIDLLNCSLGQENTNPGSFPEKSTEPATHNAARNSELSKFQALGNRRHQTKTVNGKKKTIIERLKSREDRTQKPFRIVGINRSQISTQKKTQNPGAETPPSFLFQNFWKVDLDVRACADDEKHHREKRLKIEEG